MHNNTLTPDSLATTCNGTISNDSGACALAAQQLNSISIE